VTSIIRRMAACAVLCSIVFGAGALAQSYPNKPIRLVVGFAAGGPTDVIARVVAQDMSVSLGQSVIVENKTGANAQIATEFVAHADPDGYTLLFASLSHLVNYLFVPNVRYHPLNDFAPISNGALLPMLVVTQPESPVNSIQDLIKAAKEKPGELLYGSAGNGGSAHLAAAMLERATDTKMSHVPFRGNAPALAEVMAGRITFMFYPAIGVAELVAEKKLKILAIGTRERSADFPNVPTLAEAGLDGFENTAPWVGMLAPAGTPPAIVDKLSAAMRASLAKPETKERVAKLGGIPVGDTPAQFRTFLEKDMERWARVIKASGLKADVQN
jgi:tripartite-type tricarboxylate transporter receptor subunit TctC